ncbi:hypothetical protein PR048_029891 [Dryococelus australis]|uniref:THAP-type domain-containing protein n=1 Tax=Dryococelus australis TaxID=614101 RepID=A0ABQ9G7E3_9NEOP|nr:hypothetical protein PR048_029891 [Dryococelus australis]
MPGCSMQNCKNYSTKTDSAVTYHRFTNYLVTRKTRIFVCKRKDIFKADTSRVCSFHFAENDYERDLQSELMGIKRKQTLKRDVVPHLLLPIVTPNEFPERSERVMNQIVKRKLVSDLTEMRKRKRHPENSKCEENKNNGTHVITQELNEQTMCQPGPSQTIRKNASLRQELINIKIQHRKCPKYANTKLREISKDVFTPKQIARQIFKNKKRIWWEDDDIAAAVTLCSISRKVYLYLQKNVGLQLPGLSTMYLKMDSQPEVLKHRSLPMSSRKRLTVLSFDKMRVDSRMCYDQREDRIMCPHSNAYNIIAKCLASKWKQPISYHLDKNTTKDKLFEAIKEVEEFGFKVVDIVRDMDGGNLGFGKTY